MRRSEFLTWALFYKTVLGLEAEPQVEIADPHGAFFSRSFRAANGALRIAAQYRRWRRDRRVALHRCVRRRRLPADRALDRRHLRRRRAARAPRASRSCPSRTITTTTSRRASTSRPICWRECASLGVLYDRVKDGEFLHIYTRTFHDRFFFEIVERRNYDLYGAANTPVRLAAQARLADAEERATRSSSNDMGIPMRKL